MKRKRIKHEEMDEVTDEDELYEDSDFERPSSGRRTVSKACVNIF